MEYNIYKDLDKMPNGELVSLFLSSSLSRRVYLGIEIKNIFGEYAPILLDDQPYQMVADMTNLNLVWEQGTSNMGETEVLRIPKKEMLNILLQIMDRNNTNFLITYLGNVLVR